jgi:restriction system protein
MARRGSGWTVVKSIAREIDRANRAQQRSRIAHQKALLREEERLYRQSLREEDSIIKKGGRLQEQFNNAINAASAATNLSTKESKLHEAIEKLDEIRQLSAEFSFFNLANLEQVEEGIRRIQAEVNALRNEQKRKESGAESAITQTEEAEKAREEISNVLIHTLSVDDAIDWESLKDTAQFSIPEPTKPPQPMPPPKPALNRIPDQPVSTDQKYTPQIPLFSRFFGQKKEALIHAAKQQYETDVANWRKKADALKAENEQKLQAWEEEKRSLITEWAESYRSKRASWERRRKEFIETQNQYNVGLKTLRQQYENHEKTAIEEYCSLVLSRSEYPFSFAKDYQLEYLSDSQVLALDYALPTIDVIPSLKEVKFIKSREELKKTYITDKQRQEIYDNLLYSMALRTIHELFESDTTNAVSSIIFNGWVTSLDKAVGNDTSRCILSINVTKQEFLAINLENVDPRECFKKLKGVSSAKLSSLVPVAPILNLNKEDRRFVESYDVTGKIQEGDNLAVMHWEDFEHLIRELFEREFGVSGGEVKVTQASRDGGVDAVIFDPDPIRGGKIVVQAKRYTNTVGVAAVRDLYGTVINEGAMKGILITTSDYGSDAFHFAKGKPLTLMSGANLLHLLERHGKKARIDLKEAKKA